MTVTQILSMAQIVEAIFTVLAVIVGTVWTYLLFVQKRQRFPSVKIDHQLSHRQVTAELILLSVDITLVNTGSVLLKLEDWLVVIKQLLPPRAELQRLLVEKDALVNHGVEVIEWHVLAERRETAAPGQYEIEPNDQECIHYEFLIPANVTAVLLESHFENVKKLKQGIGWGTITDYDLKSGVNYEDQTHE